MNVSNILYVRLNEMLKTRFFLLSDQFLEEGDHMLISRLLIKVDPEICMSLTLHRTFHSERLEIESELETEKLDFLATY